MSTELPPLPPMPYVMEKPAVRQYAIDYARAALAARKPLSEDAIKASVGCSDEFWATSKLWIVSMFRAAENAHGIGEKQ